MSREDPKHPMEQALAKMPRELIAKWDFTHPGDQHLTMVLVRIGPKPEPWEKDSREWVTWYYNSDSGGFSSGNYFDANEEREAREDFLRRCQQNLNRAMPKKEG